MSTHHDEIRSKTEAFAAALTTLVRRAALEAVVAALGESHPVAPSRTAAAKAPAKAALPVKKATPAVAASKPAAVAKKPASAAPAAKAPAAAAKKPVAPKRPLGAKRPPAELAKLTDKLGEYIKANPGLGMEAIGKALFTATSELTLPIKKLLADKRIRFEGQRRATKYFPL